MSVNTPLLEENEHEGDSNSLQDDTLNSLLNKNLENFQEFLKVPHTNLQFRYKDYNYFTLLQIACKLPDLGRFVKALLCCVQPNIMEVSTQPIHIAATYGQCESLRELLLDPRTNISALDLTGSTALILVCKNVTEIKVDDYLQCLNLLLIKMSPRDLNICDNDGYSAFHVLVRNPQINSKGNEDRYQSNASLLSVASVDSDGSEDALNDRKDNRDARYKLAKAMLQKCKNDLNVRSTVRGRPASEDLETNFPELKCLIFSSELDDRHKELLIALKDKKIQLLRKLLNQLNNEGTPVYNASHRFGHPYFTTCLRFACTHGLGVESIEVLLNANADPSESILPDMKSLVHLVCEKGHFNELSGLLEHKVCPDINSVDRFGNTALHYILDKPGLRKVELGRMKCLEILLKQDSLDVNIINCSGLSPIMLGIKHSHVKCLERIIKVIGSKIRWYMEHNGQTQRSMCEVFPDLLKLIPPITDISEVDNSSPSLDDQETTSNKLFKFLETDERRFVDLVKTYNGCVTLVRDKNNSHTLLQKAAFLGRSGAVTALLDAKADPNYVFDGNKSPPAVIATQNHHYHVLEIFLENRRNGFDVNATDFKGNTALHYAMRTTRNANNLKIVIQLLNCGSDLEKQNNVGKPPINNKQLESLLDQCVRTNNKTPFDDEYNLIFDYRLIALSNFNTEMDGYGKVENKNPKSDCTIEIKNDPKQPQIMSVKLKSEMHFLLRMSKNVELSFLLDHPVIITFLTLKWNRVKHLVYANIFLHILFLVILNTFIVHCAYPQSHNLERKMAADPDYLTKKSRIKRHMILMLVANLSFWFVIFLRELFQIILKKRKYFCQWENYVECFLLGSSLITVLIPFTSPNYYLQRVFNVVTILLSWTNLLILLGQTSFFTKHIQMLKIVIKNYLLPLLCYCSFVVAFGLSFHTLYRGNPKNPLPVHEDQNDFNFWDRSIVKALVMMTGELGFESFPKDSPFSMALFLLFVLLETIVIINLLAGLASRGTDEIENAAARLELITRVRAITRVEHLVVALHNKFGRFLPRCLRRYLCRSILIAGVLLENQCGTIKPNQNSELVLGGGSRMVPTASTLDRATQIISKRTENEVEKEKLTRNMSLDNFSLQELRASIRRKKAAKRCTTRS